MEENKELKQEQEASIHIKKILEYYSRELEDLIEKCKDEGLSSKLTMEKILREAYDEGKTNNLLHYMINKDIVQEDRYYVNDNNNYSNYSYQGKNIFSVSTVGGSWDKQWDNELEPYMLDEYIDDEEEEYYEREVIAGHSIFQEDNPIRLLELKYEDGRTLYVFESESEKKNFKDYEKASEYFYDIENSILSNIINDRIEKDIEEDLRNAKLYYKDNDFYIGTMDPDFRGEQESLRACFYVELNDNCLELGEEENIHSTINNMSTCNEDLDFDEDLVKEEYKKAFENLLNDKEWVNCELQCLKQNTNCEEDIEQFNEIIEAQEEQSTTHKRRR